MPECPGTQWISISIPASRRVFVLSIVHLVSGCPGPESRCSVRRNAACKSLKTATYITPFVCCVSIRTTDSQSASPIAHSSGSLTSTRPVLRWLWKARQASLSSHTAGAPTLPSLDRNPSVHHTQTPAPTLTSHWLAPCIACLFAGGSSLIMTVLTAGASSRLGETHDLCLSALFVLFLMTLHIGVPDVGWLYIPSSFEPWYALASLAVNCCCL